MLGMISLLNQFFCRIVYRAFDGRQAHEDSCNIDSSHFINKTFSVSVLGNLYTVW